METLDAIRLRRTVGKLAEPGPSELDIETMLEAADAAPDHGKLKPWRFVVYRGDDRNVLANAFADFAARSDEDDEGIESARAKALRAPVVIGCFAVEQESKKAPFLEQLMAVAAAVQNLLLAATDLGFASKWSTGQASRDDGVKTALGFAPADEIVAFVYLGTAKTEL